MTGVRRAEIIAVLSLAADLAMGQAMGFGLRLCVASLRLGKALRIGEGERGEVYYHALLRHAGCTAQTDSLAALFGDEIALRQNIAPVDIGDTRALLPVLARQVRVANAGKNPAALLGAVVAGVIGARGVSEGVFAGQCEAAGRLAQRLGLPEAVSRNLGQIYERWDGRGVPAGLAGEAIARPVRIVAVLQDALALTAMTTETEALAVIDERSGRAYDPSVVAALHDAPGVLSLASDESELWREVVRQAEETATLEGEVLDRAIEVVSDFIDLKAPAIAGHSRAVAALAQQAAGRAGLAEPTLLYRAGLLHDIGYAAVPAGLRLDPKGGEQGRLHPYYGERLLAWSDGLAPLGRVVGEHHERLDGSGFHRGARAADLSHASRVLAAAEAYQSLIEDRPFRVTLKPQQAAQRLHDAVKAGTLDGPAVAAVLEAAGQPVAAKKAALPAGLTAREVEILRQIATGVPVKQIARGLGISPKTVGNHVQNIYAKIGVGTRAGATLFAVENGLLTPGRQT